MAAGLLDEPEELAWGVSTSMFAHPTTNSINVVGKAIGGFVFAANMFSFVLVVSAALWLCQLQISARGAVVAGVLLRASWAAPSAFLEGRDTCLQLTCALPPPPPAAAVCRGG